MWKRLGVAVLVVVVLFVAAQLVRPSYANPPTNPRHTIESVLGPASALPPVLSRSCGDCHSNATVWSRYPRVAPVTWVMARAVSEGRGAVNFSEWSGYTPAQRRTLLALSCQAASAGKMPMQAYVRLRPEARLSPQDVETICAASRP